MVYIIFNFLVLYFGENFMKIRTKIANLKMHEKLDKNVNENMLSLTFLGKFHEFLWRAIKATHISKLYIVFYLNVLIHFK